MRIQIIGVGVVGEARAYLAMQLGHDVLGFDPAKSSSPYARMVTKIQKNADITFVCVPEFRVDDVIGRLVQNEIKGLYVIESTVLPGTTRGLMDKYGVHISHNPEFLRENVALDDVMHPSMVVIGQCCPEHGDLLKKFYLPLSCPIVITQPTTSEIVKLTLNAYLSTLISFWNEIDKMAKIGGVNTAEIARIVRFNPRVSSYGTAFFGAPFGGKCLPKDLDHLIEYCQKIGMNPQLLDSIRDFNRKLDDNTV